MDPNQSKQIWVGAKWGDPNPNSIQIRRCVVQVVVHSSSTYVTTAEVCECPNSQPLGVATKFLNHRSTISFQTLMSVSLQRASATLLYFYFHTFHFAAGRLLDLWRVQVGLLLLMSLLCRAKNLSPPTMRDSVVQFYNMKSLIVGCWNDLTSTHKLPFVLVFGRATHLVVSQDGICLKSCRSNGGGSSWPHNSLRRRTRGVGR